MNRIILLTVIFTLLATNAFALCAGRFLNPITDVRWNCMMPIRIAGVAMGSSGDPMATAADSSIGATGPVCVCTDPFPRVGITVGMNEVVRYVETVKDPFCMPSLGFSIASTGGLYGGTGSVDSSEAGKLNFFQTHFAVFLPFLAMNLFTDILCLQDGTSTGGTGALSIAYMSEIEGTIDGSNNSTIAVLLTPEVVLFANPFTQFYCMGDALLTAVELTDVVGYWCVGGHTIFPLTNYQTQGVDHVDSASIVAAKMIFKFTRLGSLMVCGGNQALCGCYPVPIWNKMQYRLQIAMPISDILCRRMGKPFIIWGNFPYKNPAFVPNMDNLVWLVWRRRECCAL